MDFHRGTTFNPFDFLRIRHLDAQLLHNIFLNHIRFLHFEGEISKLPPAIFESG
jgi:hypothetical protein